MPQSLIGLTLEEAKLRCKPQMEPLRTAPARPEKAQGPWRVVGERREGDLWRLIIAREQLDS